MRLADAKTELLDVSTIDMKVAPSLPPTLIALWSLHVFLGHKRHWGTLPNGTFSRLTCPVIRIYLVRGFSRASFGTK